MHGSGQRTTGAPPTRRPRGSRLSRVVVGLGLLAWLPAPLVAAAAPPASGRSAGIPRSPAFEAVYALLDANRYEAADSLARSALSRAEREHGPESLEAARALDLVVDVMGRRGGDASKEAEDALGRALAIRKRLLDPENPELAASMSGLGDFYARAEKYDKARPLLEEALAIQEKTLPPDSPRLAASLGRMGLFLIEIADYPAAVDALERQQAALELAPEVDARALAQNAYSLARVERMLGRYSGAEEDYRRSVRLTRESYGPESAVVAWPLNGLATLHENVGEYVEARRLYERALAIADSTLEPKNPFIASCLNNLAYVLVKLGDYDEARSTLVRALALARAAQEPDRARIAAILSVLAGVQSRQGNISEALSLHDEALALRESFLGPDHPFLATNLQGRGFCLLCEGKPGEAEADFRRALHILEAPVTGSSFDDLAVAAKGLGDALSAQGHLDEAAEAYAKALDTAQSKLGGNHPRVAEVCSAISALDRTRGNREEALAMALRAETVSREHLRLTAASLPETEALAYARVARTGLDQALALATQGLAPGARRSVWDALVRDRLTVLDVMAARHRALRASRDPATADKARELMDASRALAHLLVSGPEAGEGGRYGAKLEEATKRREEAERALVETSSGYGLDPGGEPAGFADVAGRVPAGGALLAYARYREAGPPAGECVPGEGGASRYLAFVLIPGTRKVEVIPLGAAAGIDSLVGEWAGQAGRPPDGEHEDALREIGSRLRATVWDPVAPYLRGADRIYIVPDGALALVNLDALPSEASSYLAETAPLFQYLSAERDLIPASRGTRANTELLAMGAPDFDAGSTGPVSGSLSATAPDSTGPGRLRGHGRTLPTLKGVRFRPLPATATEVRTIAGVWRDVARRGSAGAGGGKPVGPVRLLTGSAATEAAFKLEAPRARVIHLATHGFFLDGSGTPGGTGTRGIAGLSPRRPAPARADNPFLLAGLAMAGANHRDADKPGSEDGILTAQEIAVLDLTGADWVVLSACETGVGRIRTGEGVMGLRRAFQIAGAHALVMSLWAVDDEAASDWMESFYRARITGEKDAAAAARAATLNALAHTRTKTGGDNPFYWGGFIAVGAGAK